MRAVATQFFDGREVTEGLLNHIEVAIRAYDPCLSCATHALGADAARSRAASTPTASLFSRAGAGAERMRLVVFGWGNDSRGDDGLGPALLRRVEARGLEGVTTVEDYQLQIEHALDLDGADLALFVDAARAGRRRSLSAKSRRAPKRPTRRTRWRPRPCSTFIDRCAARRRRRSCSRVRGESFGLGEGFSPEGVKRLEAAWRFLAELLREPDARVWRRIAQGKSRGEACRGGVGPAGCA